MASPAPTLPDFSSHPPWPATTACGRLWEIRNSGIHGRGLFATETVPRGTRLLEYVGEKITKAEARRRAERQVELAKNGGGGAVYIFELNQRSDLDGNVEWNPARLINHSCRPNCVAYRSRGHIWIEAKRRLRLGEELTYNYGYDAEHYRDHPCRCGLSGCLGYIVAPGQRRRLARLRQAEAGR